MFITDDSTDDRVTLARYANTHNGSRSRRRLGLGGNRDRCVTCLCDLRVAGVCGLRATAGMDPECNCQGEHPLQQRLERITIPEGH